MICQRRPDHASGDARSASTSSAAGGSASPNTSMFAASSGVSPVDRLNRAERSGVLSRIIEDQIVPTMLLGHNAPPLGDQGQAWENDAEIEKFVALIIANDLVACLAWIDHLRAKGVPSARLKTGLLSQAARRLGTWWDADRCSFVDVTVGVGMLQRILHCLGQNLPTPRRSPGDTRRILLAGLPGERHSFGLQMVADAFTQSGWDATVRPAIATADLMAVVEENDFTVAGLSIATRDQTDQLAQAIRVIRRHSANPNIGVMIGGPLVLTWPNLPSLVGADVAAADADQAVIRADGLRMLFAAIAPGQNRHPLSELGYGSAI